MSFTPQAERCRAFASDIAGWLDRLHQTNGTVSLRALPDRERFHMTIIESLVLRRRVRPAVRLT